MFTEILRIKPVLDPGSAKAMDASLSQRFGRVAQKFGAGLKSIIKGTVLGISLGLLNRLLNPINDLEERIKSLLGQGTDIKDLADRFGTSPAQLKRLESVAGSLGVSPDQLKEVLTKYAETVETARKELADPFQERSAATRAVSEFAGDTDLAESFIGFLKGIQATAKGPDRQVFFGEKKQFSRNQTGAEAAAEVQKEVFGGVQFGAMRRLFEADITKQGAKLKLPSDKATGAAIEKTAGLDSLQQTLKAQREASDFVQTSGLMNEKMVRSIEESQARADEKARNELKNFDDMRKVANGVEEIKISVQKISDFALKIAGLFGDLLGFLRKWESTGIMKRFFGK